MERLRVIASESQSSQSTNSRSKLINIELPSIKEKEKKIVVKAVEEDRNSLNNSFSDSESISEQVPIEESSDKECFEIPPDLSEDDLLFEQFTIPDLDDLEFEPDHEYPGTNINFDDSIVLLDIDQLRFEKFPTSSYMTRKFLGIGKQEVTFAVCPSCNTLYKVTEILPTGHKCTHVEYPNHSMRNQRRPCGTELTNKILVNNGFVRRPKMLFPIPSLKMQIMTMYQRSGFKELLQKWTNRITEM
ncbi:11804_t:CDS:2, partial [Funneliformis caledonium]